MTHSSLPINTTDLNSFTDKSFSLLHSKQKESLANAVSGVLVANSLIPSKIGEGLAELKGRHPKHTKKQVDRLLSNEAIDVNYCQNVLAQFLIGNRSRIYVAKDWTVFHKDSQMIITLKLVTTHGRATPLLWKTVSSKNIKGKKNNHVKELLFKLRQLAPKTCEVIVLADREFGTLKTMKYLREMLGFHYILRIKRNFTVTSSDNKKRLAHEWISGEETKSIDNAKITVKDYPIKKVVISKQPAMKDIWCLVCSLKNIATQTVLDLYGKRWTTETSYRDEKDLQFGMGLKKSRIRSLDRRDRLLLISAIVIIILTLFGAASEAAGYDKYIKSNTSKKRTHSLFSQGKVIIKLLHKLPDQWMRAIHRELQLFICRSNNILSDTFVI